MTPKALTEMREGAYTLDASWKKRDHSRKTIKGCRNLLSRRRKGQEPKDLMQTYRDRRSPSQVKVGHRGETRRGTDQCSSGLFIFGMRKPIYVYSRQKAFKSASSRRSSIEYYRPGRCCQHIPPPESMCWGAEWQEYYPAAQMSQDHRCVHNPASIEVK